MVNATEVGKAKGANVFVDRIVTGNNWQFGWWFSCFTACPHNIWCFYVGVRQVEDRGELFDVKNIAAIHKKAGFVLSKVFLAKAWARQAKPVQVGAVELFKGTHNRLYAQLGVHGTFAKVGHANFYLVAKLGRFFFGLGDTGFFALGKLFGCATRLPFLGWFDKGAEQVAEPFKAEALTS